MRCDSQPASVRRSSQDRPAVRSPAVRAVVETSSVSTPTARHKARRPAAVDQRQDFRDLGVLAAELHADGRRSVGRAEHGKDHRLLHGPARGRRCKVREQVDSRPALGPLLLHGGGGRNARVDDQHADVDVHGPLGNGHRRHADAATAGPPPNSQAWSGWAKRHGIPLETVLLFSHGRPTIATMDHFLPGQDHTAELEEMTRDEETEVEGIVAVPGAKEVVRGSS